jgi:hypothetical protein
MSSIFFGASKKSGVPQINFLVHSPFISILQISARYVTLGEGFFANFEQRSSYLVGFQKSARGKPRGDRYQNFQGVL